MTNPIKLGKLELAFSIWQKLGKLELAFLPSEKAGGGRVM